MNILLLQLDGKFPNIAMMSLGIGLTDLQAKPEYGQVQAQAQISQS